MKKKLASLLYNMNYELATYSCADKLVESPATNAHRGCGQTWLAICAVRASSMHYSLTVSVVSWADSRELEVYHSWYIQHYVWLSHS